MPNLIRPGVGRSPLRGFVKPAKFVIDQNHPLSRGLLAFWPLGDNGNKAFDAVGLYDAAAANGPLSLATGFAGGQATTFNGSNQGLVPAGLGAAPTVFSIVCLAKSTSTSRQAYAASSNSGVTAANFYFETDRFGGGSSGVFSEITYTAPSANVWHGVACTADNTAAVVYVDGVQVQSGAIQRSGGVSAGDFAIGRFGSFTGGQFFGGQLEAMRLYNRVLSASEILALYLEPYAGLLGQSMFAATFAPSSAAFVPRIIIY